MITQRREDNTSVQSSVRANLLQFQLQTTINQQQSVSKLQILGFLLPPFLGVTWLKLLVPCK